MNDPETREVFFRKLAEELDGYAWRFGQLHANNGRIPAVVQPADIAYHVREAAKATERFFTGTTEFIHAYAARMNLQAR